MLKNRGFNEFAKTLEEAQAAVASLGEEFRIEFSIDPDDPASIQAAIQKSHDIIDARLHRYIRNEFVANLAEELKRTYREAIVEKANAARLESDAD